MGIRLFRLSVLAISAIAIGGLAASADAAGAGAPRSIGFKAPTLFPDFSPGTHDYTVRCDDQPVKVRLHASGPWRVAVDHHRFRRGEFDQTIPLRSGETFVVTTIRRGRPALHHFHVRCLPKEFPGYRFIHQGPVHLGFFSVDASFFIPYPLRYSIIFDRHGVPIWWRHTTARDTRVLPGGNVLWFQRKMNRWEVHRLDGSLVRVLPAVDLTADPHDLQPLGNGDYLVGAYVTEHHVDTSAYGGSSDADVLNTELQQVTPGGELAWDWSSKGHISLAETGRWWPHVTSHAENGYDALHWNSIEPDGGSVIASFRNLDAVYKIDKTSGAIVWKLGGTTTPESLGVKGDPRHYTFGGQHDARLLSDGSLTVFDDRTELPNEVPRAVHYRINERNGTAKLLESISDRAVPASSCCGSARRLRNGSWLVDWGRNPTKQGVSNGVGAYEPNGRRAFLLSFRQTASYRAEPVANGGLTARELREGMRAMCRAGCG